MEELIPVLHNLAQGREISGLEAYVAIMNHKEKR